MKIGRYTISLKLKGWYSDRGKYYGDGDKRTDGWFLCWGPLHIEKAPIYFDDYDD